MPRVKSTSNPTSLHTGQRTSHTQVTGWMRQQITSGHWKVGDRLPSYNEIRQHYGVHTSTMEKVFAQLETEGLIVRRRGSGTYVADRVLKTTSKASIIGLCGAGFSFADYSPYWAQLLGGVREAAAQAGMQILILDPRVADGWEKADGTLVCDWNDPRVPRKTPPGMPLVSLMTPIEGMASVIADDEGGVYQATQHLIELGHRRIAYLHAYPDHASSRNRIAGYRRALTEAGIKPKDKWTRCLRGHFAAGQRYITGGRKNMLLWLRDDWGMLGCTALLCHNDEAAYGVIEALSESGIRVPEDVSVMGFDGTEYSQLVKPRVSTVQIPLRDIGAAAVELLLDHFRSGTPSSTHRIIPTFVKPQETTLKIDG